MIANSPDPSRLQVYLKNYSFTPKWLFLVGTVLLVLLFVQLGFWQLHRAEQKRWLQQHYDVHMRAQPTELLQLPKMAYQDLQYYPVKMAGRYDNAHNFLLDNKIQNHQVGYEVVTPLILANQQAVLVDRGWIPLNDRSAHLPTIAPVLGVQKVQGFIYMPSKKAFTLGDPYIEAAKQVWPLRVEALEVPMAAKILHRPVYPYLIWLHPASANGFIRHWQPVNMPAARHVGYAVQWFTFAAVLIIIFFALNIHRR